MIMKFINMKGELINLTNVTNIVLTEVFISIYYVSGSASRVSFDLPIAAKDAFEQIKDYIKTVQGDIK